MNSILKIVGKLLQTVTAYDNINFKANKREEVVGHKAEMYAMTTGAIVLCPELPPNGLDQSMHDPTVPLDIGDIFSSPALSASGDDEIGVQITRSLIADAIKTSHPAAVQALFHRNKTYCTDSFATYILQGSCSSISD
jgi:hypothetical protein